MTAPATAEMCRIVVCGPDRQLEISVPAEVVVADLLPVLLQHLGDGLADTGLGHGGWILQRLGSPPMDEDATVGDSGLVDGTVVHLRPRDEQIPPVHFDDLADGLATGVRARAGVWRPEMARWAAAGTLAVALGAGILTIGAAGPVPARAIVAGVLALAFLGAGAIFTRAFGDRLFGVVAAVGGLAYAGLAGLIAPDASTAEAPITFGAAQMFTAAVIVTVLGVIGGLLVGRSGPAIAAVVTASGTAAVGAGLALFAGLTQVGAGAAAAVLATVLTSVVPATAFRLARIRLAPLPTKPEHLQEDIDPEPSEPLMRQAALADRYMTGLHLGLAVVAGAGLVLVAPYQDWAAYTLIGLVVVVRLLAARPMTSGWHRLLLALPAAAGFVAATVSALTASAPVVRLSAVPGLTLLLAVLLYVTARHLEDRRMMPVWGRAGDIVQLVVTVALLPVLAAILGLYGGAQALGG